MQLGSCRQKAALPILNIWAMSRLGVLLSAWRRTEANWHNSSASRRLWILVCLQESVSSFRSRADKAPSLKIWSTWRLLVQVNRWGAVLLCRNLVCVGTPPTDNSSERPLLLGKRMTPRPYQTESLIVSPCRTVRVLYLINYNNSFWPKVLSLLSYMILFCFFESTLCWGLLTVILH